MDRSSLDDFDLSIRAYDLGPDYRVDFASDEPRRDDAAFTGGNPWTGFDRRDMREPGNLQLRNVQRQQLTGSNTVRFDPRLRAQFVSLAYAGLSSLS